MGLYLPLSLSNSTWSPRCPPNVARLCHTTSIVPENPRLLAALFLSVEHFLPIFLCQPFALRSAHTIPDAFVGTIFNVPFAAACITFSERARARGGSHTSGVLPRVMRVAALGLSRVQEVSRVRRHVSWIVTVEDASVGTSPVSVPAGVARGRDKIRGNGYP